MVTMATLAPTAIMTGGIGNARPMMVLSGVSQPPAALDFT